MGSETFRNGRRRGERDKRRHALGGNLPGKRWEKTGGLKVNGTDAFSTTTTFGGCMTAVSGPLKLYRPTLVQRTCQKTVHGAGSKE